jgi:hypothetical protein
VIKISGEWQLSIDTELMPEAVELVRRLAIEWIRSLEDCGRITVSPQQSSKILRIMVEVLRAAAEAASDGTRAHHHSADSAAALTAALTAD